MQEAEPNLNRTVITGNSMGRYSDPGRLVWIPVIGFALLIAVGVASSSMMTLLPKGILPLEDNGYLFVDMQLPDAATCQRTEVVAERLSEQLRAIRGVANTIKVNVYSLLNGQGSNGALIFVNLLNWDERDSEMESADSILAKTYAIASQEASAKVIAFNPPPISGLGVSDGGEMTVQQTSGGNAIDHKAAVNSLVYAANQRPELSQTYKSFSPGVQEFLVDLAREKAGSLGVPMSDVFQTSQAHLGFLSTT